MDISTILNITLCILSFLLAVISVVTVVATLKQNNKMLENATRPYVAFSYETLQTSEYGLLRYILVKNYGQSSATFTNINTDIQDINGFCNSFFYLKGATLAPSQSLLYYYGKIEEGSTDIVTFDFTYTSENKTYVDKNTVKMSSGNIVVRCNDSESIPFTLQEIVERLF